MIKDELYIKRCFDLARLGAGNVSPNPMVGAVLVYENRIIGEGWHQRYGEAHAEVNALRSVKPEDQALISLSTLYVSLEPCNIFGKTPPCTNLILEHKIPRVVISCLDQTPEVAGKGVEMLRANGVEVVTCILESEGKAVSRYRNHFVTHNRPYVILKFAQTLNGRFSVENEQTWISNSYSQRLVHKWRSEVDAILVGTNTALIDNPQLNNRLYIGKSPIRIVIDRHLKLPKNLHLFDRSQPTLVVTETQNLKPGTPSVATGLPQAMQNLTYLSLDFEKHFLSNFLNKLHQLKIATLLVEGGAQLLQSFINENLWDEALVFTSSQPLEKGIAAPLVSGALVRHFTLADNQLICYQNVHNR